MVKKTDFPPKNILFNDCEIIFELSEKSKLNHYMLM